MLDRPKMRARPTTLRSAATWLCVAVSTGATAGVLLACASLTGLSGGAAGEERDGGVDGAVDAKQEMGFDADLDADLDVKLGDGNLLDDAEYDAADAMVPATGAVQVSSGLFLPVWCAVTKAGEVECWGDNEVGELGNGTLVSSATPVKVPGIKDATEVSVGNATVCALTKQGAVWCWGYGGDGELGNGAPTMAQKSPVQVTGLESGVFALSVGGYDACAIKQVGSTANQGSVWCWGLGGLDLVNDTGTGNAPAPVAIPALSSGVTAVSVGGYSACALKGGGVLCWGGTDGNGELGNGTMNASPTPVAVMNLSSGVASVSVGSDFACALTHAGNVECWGDGTQGALGNGGVQPSAVPVAVMLQNPPAAALAAGNNMACAIDAEQSVNCWGYGAEGELGTGTTTFGPTSMSFSSSIPQLVDTLTSPDGGATNPTALSAGAAPCALMTGGYVECWGPTGELALNPVPVTGLTSGVSSVTIGGYSTGFACALGASGSVSCWGGND